MGRKSKAKNASTLLKTRRFYNKWDMVLQFKTHVLCVLESATAAVYHAADGALAPLGARILRCR